MCDPHAIFGEVFDSFVFGSNNLEKIPITIDPEFHAQESLNVFNVHDKRNSELKMQVV